MRVEDWAPEQITVEVEKKAMDQLEQAGEIVAGIARLLCPVGKARPIYKGKKAWTERVPGTLKKSIRVRRLRGDPKLDVRVYAGARQSDKLTAYYAHMVEYGTVEMKAKPFLRPAFNSAKAKIKAMLGAE
jgi:HK97 gp10 family phage protein